MDMNRNIDQKGIGVFAKMWYALKNEYRFMFRDVAVVFSMLFIAIVISFVYTYIYSRQVLSGLPVVVVDHDQTTESRLLTRMLDATPQADAAFVVSDFSEAEVLFDEGKARGIVVIPSHFGRDLNRQAQPSVSVFADASYILYYKQVYKAMSLVVSYMNAGVEIKKLKAKGDSERESKQNASPVQAKIVGLFNPDSGYAIFVMPAVFLVIIQTTMLTGIGLLGGTFRERKRFANAHTEVTNIFDAIAIVLGKALAYTSVGLFVFTVIVGMVLPLFDMPQRGNILDLYLYVLPYILAISFLGITLNRFFRHREDAVMTIIFTSIPVLLLCGVSWPQGEIPSFLAGLSQIIPSSAATKGFVAISQAGSRLMEVEDVWLHVWGLCAFYFILSVLTMKRLLKEAK
jgi:ABC-2 type transport system permease protein